MFNHLKVFKCFRIINQFLRITPLTAGIMDIMAIKNDKNQFTRQLIMNLSYILINFNICFIYFVYFAYFI